MFKNKDQILNFMISGQIHLGKKDYGFFNNLCFMIKDKRPITTNQTKLFDKLLLKYRKQIKNSGHDVNHLLTLFWLAPVVETSNEYTDPKLYLDNDILKLRCPFNTKFVTAFRKVKYNPFVWSKEHKCYEANFSTYGLKVAYKYVNEYYQNVKYCDTIKKLLDNVLPSENLIWNPTLKLSNGNYYICNANDNLLEAIKDIDMNLDPNTLFELSQYGITVDPKLISNNEILKFASNFYTTVDLDDMDKVLSWCKELGIKDVYFNREVVYNKVVSSELQKKLKEQDIALHTEMRDLNKEIFMFYINRNNESIFYTKQKAKIKKFVAITNSRPILIK